MNKKQIIEKLVDRTGFNKETVSKTLEELLDLITDTLENNGVINLGGFGSFEVETAPTVSGRNPHTGQEQYANPRRRVRFKAGAELSANIN